MKNFIIFVIGVALGILFCYYLICPKPCDDKRLGFLPTEEEVSFLEQYADSLQSRAKAVTEYDSGKGKFIKKVDFKNRTDAFDKWVKQNRVVSKVLIPNSFFIGKDSLKKLYERMEMENSKHPNKDPKKIAGLVIKLTLVEDEITLIDSDGNPFEYKGNRIDPVMVPVRVNKGLHRTDPKNNKQNGGQGTGSILDDTMPCPDNC